MTPTLNELADRIRGRCVSVPSGCLVWQGAKSNNGYGQIGTGVGTSSSLTHRVMYEAAKGPIPKGLQIDHLCRNRACCNPAHLEAVTPLENSRRGIAGKINGDRQRAKTHCPNRHEYTAENTYVCKQGKRSCKTCAIERQKIRRARHAEAA